MGLVLLVIFVGGSLAFSLWAWAGYDHSGFDTAGAHSEEARRDEKDTPLVLTLGIVTFLSAFLSELLRHSFRLSFVEAAAISLGVLVVGQWISVRFFNPPRQTGKDGRGARPQS
jgi:amino acid transporter